jgi:hypothetical protein
VGVPGWLCVYETGPDANARDFAVTFDPRNWVFGAEGDAQDSLGTRGFVIWGTGQPSGMSYSTGVWAVEAAAPGARLAGVAGKGGYGRPGE